ncbi:MAG: glycerate kinase [Intestinibacter sp.]|uniref:glycerate kinase family protein n=1 Tax=Intestinibacter sp. TaxID=1965304 RepID=UPI0025BF3F4B|nr:glycerate kinase [Intestinibacter sp.]MCI6736875.1 glycerate kinase [Intestinibacter sp.]
MKVVIAIDSLKGSLSSVDAGNAIKEGVLEVCPDAEVVVKPLADGGEGTIEALVQGMKGIEYKIEVHGPLGKKVTASYGIIEEGEKTAIIEMAQAAGITLVSKQERNPLYTTTYGVGEIIKDAIHRGCRKFIVGIGGSATNDAGVGMMQALGYKFYDVDGNLLGLGGQILDKIHRIDQTEALKELSECSFKVACDVDNLLYGKNGASYIYGPQKGATEEIVKILDNGLINLSKVVNNTYENTPGAGAAGGLGYGFMTFLGGKLESGIDIILKEINLEEDIKDADVVVTGEGRLDAQTIMGKAPIGVAKLAKKYSKKVIALGGSLTNDAYKVNEHGIDAVFSIVNEPMTLEKAMESEVAKFNLKMTAKQIFNLMSKL